MKKGDEVTLRDGSRMIAVNRKTGELSHHGECGIIGHCRDKFIIIDMCGDYPAEQLTGFDPRRNDTMLFNTKTKEIWFCTAGISLVYFSDHNEDTYELDGIEYSESTLRSLIKKATS